MSFTEINISFDTEDYTSNRAADAIRDTALLLTEEGVTATYNLVGYVGRQLIQWRRFDVLEALKSHEISSHTKGHSMHPTVCEYADIADYDAAHTVTLREEQESMGMIRAATGATRIAAGCPPGNSRSYVAQYVYAECGIDAYTDSNVYMPDGSPVYMCGLSHFKYDTSFEGMQDDDFDMDALIERLSRKKRVIVYNHPNCITHSRFWDGVNYKGENKHAFGEWEEAPRNTAEYTVKFYENMRLFVRKIKDAKNEDGSPKFVFRTINEMVDADKRNRVVKRAGAAVYLDALGKSLADGSFDLLTLSQTAAEPISLSECLYAATKFATTDANEVSLNGLLLKGFLDSPQGVESPTTVTRDDVVDAAKTIDFEKFLPTSIECGDVKVGPLDLLIALLTFVANPAQSEVTLEPIPQQPPLDAMPDLRDQKLAGTWVNTPEFKDEYISDRLRLQAWTAHN